MELLCQILSSSNSFWAFPNARRIAHHQHQHQRRPVANQAPYHSSYLHPHLQSKASVARGRGRGRGRWRGGRGSTVADDRKGKLRSSFLYRLLTCHADAEFRVRIDEVEEVTSDIVSLAAPGEFETSRREFQEASPVEPAERVSAAIVEVEVRAADETRPVDGTQYSEIEHSRTPPLINSLLNYSLLFSSQLSNQLFSIILFYSISLFSILYSLFWILHPSFIIEYPFLLLFYSPPC